MMSVGDGLEFEGRLSAAMGELNAAHGKVVALVAEVIERDGWVGGGFRSPEHYISVRAGVAMATAKRLVQVARRREELPATVARLDAGSLTLDHASTVAAFVPAYAEEQAAGIAEHATVPQLRSLVARYRFAENDEKAADEPGSSPPESSQEPPPEVAAAAAGALHSWHDESGRYHLKVEAPVDEGAQIEQAIKHARDIAFHDPGRGEAPVRDYDGFLAACRRSFEAGAEPRDKARRSRFGVYAHLDQGGAGWLDGGRALPPSLLAKITCDGAVRPVWEREGVAVSVGRAQRVAPPHTRRLVIDRDTCCRFPGCGATTALEVHHIQHWADGGPTDTPNLLSLCPHHHDAHHRGEFTIAGDADAVLGDREWVRFSDPRGRPIGPLRPKPPDHPPPEPAAGYRTRSGERFDHSLVTFREPPAA